MRRWMLVVGVYVMLTLIALHQPLSHLSTHMPGDRVTDYYHFHWNYGWMRHALTDGLNIYQTNYVFSPFTSSLAYHTLAASWYPVWAVIEPIAGTFAAFAVIQVTAFTLCGVTFYALLRREGVSGGLALVGGAMLAFTPLMFFAAFWSMTSLIAWFWLPLALLTWGELARARSQWAALRWAGLFGVTLWAMLLTDLQYPVFLAFLMVPYGLWTLWRSRYRARLIASGLFTLTITLALLWIGGTLPALLAFDRTGLAPTPVERAAALDFPVEYLSVRAGDSVTLGVVVIPLFLASIIFFCRNALLRVRYFGGRPKARPYGKEGGGFPLPEFGEGIRGWGHLSHSPAYLWLFAALIPLILSAGGTLQIFGTTLSLPYQTFHAAFGGMFRYPERFGVVFLIAAVMFSLKTLTVALKDRSRLRRIVPLILMLMVIADSRLFYSIPIQPQPTRYAIYDQMRDEPYDYMVLEVPTGGSSGEGIVGLPEFSALQFYGSTHGKRMFNGHISRVNTAHYWWTRTDDALMAWLGQRRYIEPELVESQLRERIFSYPIGYIVVHTDLIEPNSVTQQEVIGYLNGVDDLLCSPTTEGALVIYRTRSHPDGCDSRTPAEMQQGVYTLDFGGDDTANIGWGFYYREDIFGTTIRWIGEYPQTLVYADLPPGRYIVSINAQSFMQDRRVNITANDVSLGNATITPDALNGYNFDTPLIVNDEQRVTLTLDYDRWIVPAEVGMGGDTRKLAIALESITFQRVE